MDAHRGEGLARAWRKGRPADVRRDRSDTSVLSIRMPTELLESLGALAAEQGKPASVMAREIIERALESGWPRTAPELARAFSRWVDEMTHAPRVARRSRTP